MFVSSVYGPLVPWLWVVAECAPLAARTFHYRLCTQSVALSAAPGACNLPPAPSETSGVVDVYRHGDLVHNRSQSMTISRRQGVTYFLVNQLACPGIGTIMAGRKIGFVQAAVMIGGFCLTLAFGLMYISAVYKFALDGSATEEKWKAMQPPLWMGIGGFALCGVAWFWSLFSSFQILHESRRHQSV
jgi:hypothetical protein